MNYKYNRNKRIIDGDIPKEKEEFLNVIEEVLQSIKYFPKNRISNRKNLFEEKNHKRILCFCLGKTKWYYKKELVNCKHNKRFKYLYKLFSTFLSKFYKDFEYTTIQINKNVLCNYHKDKNNEGLSLTFSLGDYKSGGGIMYKTEDDKEHVINNYKDIKLLNGNLFHRTIKHEGGDRYAIIIFKRKN